MVDCCTVFCDSRYKSFCFVRMPCRANQLTGVSQQRGLLRKGCLCGHSVVFDLPARLHCGFALIQQLCAAAQSVALSSCFVRWLALWIRRPFTLLRCFIGRLRSVLLGCMYPFFALFMVWSQPTQQGVFYLSVLEPPVCRCLCAGEVHRRASSVIRLTLVCRSHNSYHVVHAWWAPT
jgi:hypothetical protein